MHETEKTEMDIKIITGMSGAGKTQVIQVLEDLGYYCVDNLPPNLFVKFAELAGQAQFQLGKVALVADIRGGKFFLDLYDSLAQLKSKGIPYEIIFLEANDDVLVRRFKETRRRHPLYSGSILDAIREERRRLQSLRGMADIVIDTSSMRVRQLKEKMLMIFRGGTDSDLNVSVVSFGYKYGLPIDADIVIDVRFLPNPFYIEELKYHRGEEKAVKNYVLEQPQTESFLQNFSNLLTDLCPMYVKEGKKHLAVAVGCTGGQHRSVAIADELVKRLMQKSRERGYTISSIHRDIDKANLKKE